MDISEIKHKIIAEVVLFVRLYAENYVPTIDPELQKDKNRIVLIAILRLTKNFLLVLDDRKAPAYKLAIIQEYLEYVQAAVMSDIVQGVGVIDKDISVILRYINLIKADPERVELLIKNTQNTVHKFADVKDIQPDVVTFWLQESCTMDALRKMQTLLLFCSRQEQNKIFTHDASLKSDKRVSVLLNCINEC